jgi:hypothetical protein
MNLPASPNHRYTYTDVNSASVPLAPVNAMQFGPAIHRILHRIAYANPAFGPLYLSKFDLSDGYYRVPLNPQAALELAVVLPPLADKSKNAPLIGIPLVLPMGWKYSPPFFCAYTESATDITNAALLQNKQLPPHTLDDILPTFPTEVHKLAQQNLSTPLPTVSHREARHRIQSVRRYHQQRLRTGGSRHRCRHPSGHLPNSRTCNPLMRLRQRRGRRMELKRLHPIH